jgi:acyl-CoA synthetase (AMP-forming)/AMP-acid ligase II
VKDIIIRKGENISANEIEDLLYRHPSVGEAAVIGLPDRERGELVCAVIIAAEGQPALGFDQMVKHFRDARVMSQKIPERLELIDEMPRNPTGKVLKKELVARFAPGS